MTSSLPVTTLSVPRPEYTLHIHAGIVASCLRLATWDPEVSGTGLSCHSAALSLGKALHLYVHSANPGANGYLVGQCLLVFE